MRSHTTAAVLQYVELYSLLVIPAVEHAQEAVWILVCVPRATQSLILYRPTYLALSKVYIGLYFYMHRPTCSCRPNSWGHRAPTDAGHSCYRGHSRILRMYDCKGSFRCHISFSVLYRNVDYNMPHYNSEMLMCPIHLLGLVVARTASMTGREVVQLPTSTHGLYKLLAAGAVPHARKVDVQTGAHKGITMNSTRNCSVRAGRTPLLQRKWYYI